MGINITSDSFYILNSWASWQRYKSLLNNKIIGECNSVINLLMEVFFYKMLEFFEFDGNVFLDLVNCARIVYENTNEEKNSKNFC